MKVSDDQKLGTALITGASQGLGKFLAECFWRAGYDLLLVSRNITSLQNLAEELRSTVSHSDSEDVGLRRIAVYACDFASPSSLDEFIKTLYLEHKSLDVLINNAAIQGPVGSSADIWANNPSKWNEAIQIDLLSPIELSSRLIPLLAKSGKGSIINLSGGGATGPRANFAAYATAKAGLVRFSETLAEEVNSLGIRVNCIAPGAMKTAMMEEVISIGPTLAGIKEYEAAKKIFTTSGASMKKVAALALFLAGTQSLGVTGRLISAMWDNWGILSNEVQALKNSDLFTLRRISGRDRGLEWADL